MRANFAFSTLTATALLGAASASAAVLTVTPSTTTLSGVTADGSPAVTPSMTSTGVLYSDYGSTSATTFETAVVTAPTTTASGLAYLYEITTVSQTRTDTVVSADYFYWDQALTGNTAGSEYLIFSGSLGATAATTASLYVYSAGDYTGVASPFGTSVPALPSYYFRLAGTGAWTLLGSSSTTTGNEFQGGEATTFSLAAGSTTSFEVAVMAGSNVDLSNVGLVLASEFYDVHTETVTLGSTTTKTLVGAQLLAPVPEPETYALILAGLLFVGLRMRSQR